MPTGVGAVGGETPDVREVAAVEVCEPAFVGVLLGACVVVLVVVAFVVALLGARVILLVVA